MERTLRFRDDVVEKISGVVRVDQTGRLQTVRKEWNERFHALLRTFYERTGVPILVHTSLHPMDKPIVHSVEDAVAVLSTSGLDALVLENIILEK